MDRIRICQLITELRLSGAERVVYELSTRLDRQQFDVQVVSLRGGQVADMLRDAGIRCTVLGVRGKWDVLRLGDLTDLLRRDRVDVLHTHLFHADLAGRPAARLAAVPHLVHTVHVAEQRFRPWRFAYARLLGGYCDRIICVSESVRAHHLAHSGLPQSLYTVIPNGIDVPKYARDESARRRLRDEWKLRDDQVLAGFVGRLDPQKGIDVLVSAAAHLAARGTPMELVIAGDGPRRGLVENFVACGEGGRHTRFLGFVQDVAALYSALDLLVLPSRWEGWPLTAAEAMAAGLPVIGARSPGVVDVVVDGVTGLLFEPTDSIGLAELLDSTLRDEPLRRRLSQAAAAKAQEYDIAANIVAHQRLYREVVAGQGAGV
jgi:glycosyltransferase involved in cell wall biosynthesis